VTVGKRVVQGTERVGGEVRKEVVCVEREGDVDVRESGTGTSST
jgi:stress response protein YsnF